MDKETKAQRLGGDLLDQAEMGGQCSLKLVPSPHPSPRAVRCPILCDTMLACRASACSRPSYVIFSFPVS